MTPGARLEAAIELLAEIHGGSAPADRAAAAFFRKRRYVGGQDRRAVIDRVYDVLRRRAALDWWIARLGDHATDRARVVAALSLLEGWSANRIADLFDGGRYRPAPLAAAEQALTRRLAGRAILDPAQPAWVRLEYPRWLEHTLRNLFGTRFEAEMAALMAAAPVDLRVNALKATRSEAMSALAASGITATPTPLSPLGLRIEGRPPLATLPVFRDGLVEVQDEGSQLVALLTGARPGMRVVDFCAGAGGKTLAIAAEMRNKGRIVACEVLRGRAERAATRFKRAGVHNVERRPLANERDPWIKHHAGGFDRVLVDAPCSGVGTWRRNPDAKWRLSAPALNGLVEVQRRILASAARLVSTGGRLVYATCSLLPAENDAQLSWFLDRHPGFAPLPMAQVWAETVGRMPDAGTCPDGEAALRLTPASHGTDGFFVVVLERGSDAPSTEPGE